MSQTTVLPEAIKSLSKISGPGRNLSPLSFQVAGLLNKTQISFQSELLSTNLRSSRQPDLGFGDKLCLVQGKSYKNGELTTDSSFLYFLCPHTPYQKLSAFVHSSLPLSFTIVFCESPVLGS